jgi:hypothetical protein
MGLWLSCLGAFGCPATHDTGDATVRGVADVLDVLAAAEDASACARPRTVTLVVVVNSDGANDLREYRAEVVEEVVARLISGDSDGDGDSDSAPVEEIRVMATYNQICLGDEYDGYDAEWVSPRDGICRGDDDSVVQSIRAGPGWQEELRCRLVPRASGGCVPEPPWWH